MGGSMTLQVVGTSRWSHSMLFKPSPRGHAEGPSTRPWPGWTVDCRHFTLYSWPFCTLHFTLYSWRKTLQDVQILSHFSIWWPCAEHPSTRPWLNYTAVPHLVQLNKNLNSILSWKFAGSRIYIVLYVQLLGQLNSTLCAVQWESGL